MPCLEPWGHTLQSISCTLRCHLKCGSGEFSFVQHRTCCRCLQKFAKDWTDLLAALFDILTTNWMDSLSRAHDLNRICYQKMMYHKEHHLVPSMIPPALSFHDNCLSFFWINSNDSQFVLFFANALEKMAQIISYLGCGGKNSFQGFHTPNKNGFVPPLFWGARHFH